MKLNQSIGSLALTLLALCVANTSAGPLRRADVAADLGWLVHIDCDRLRPTALGQHILAELNKPEAQSKLDAFESLLGLDPRTQLHGITLYSSGASAREGVLLVYADFDAVRLTTLAKNANDSQEIPYKNQVIYSWIDENKKAKDGVSPRIYAAIVGPRVIFAQREERVSHAIDVLTGATPNLAAGDLLPQLGAAANTSFVQAVARRLDFTSSDPNAVILRLAKQASLELSEQRQQVSATLTLEAKDEEIATAMGSIARGLITLLKLQKEKTEPARIAEALLLKQQSSSLLLSLNLPANEVIDLIKAHAAQPAHKKAAK